MATVSPAEFIKAYQSSNSIPEVMEKLGMAEKAVRSRMAHYRKKGIPLKKFLSRRAGKVSLKIDELKKLAQSLLLEKEEK